MVMDWYPIQRGVDMILFASSYSENRDKHQRDEPLGSYTDSPFLPTIHFTLLELAFFL